MLSTIFEAIVAFLKTFPIIAEWFRKSELEKERQARERIDKTHDKEEEEGRPNDSFWKDRHL